MSVCASLSRAIKLLLSALFQLSLILHLSLIGQSQVSLRSLKGSYLVVHTEPKILRLVKLSSDCSPSQTYPTLLLFSG